MCQRMPYRAFPHRGAVRAKVEGKRVSALHKKTLSESAICDLFISPAIKGAGWDQSPRSGARSGWRNQPL
jgi:hypothetical protein